MSVKIDKPIKNFLLDFGLTDKEIALYLTLLKTGPNTIMNLARETNIKRSTTHNNVEELIKKGLVSQTNYGERRMVIAEDPEKLKFLMEQKRWDMKKLEENLPDAIKKIVEAVPNAKENSKVEVKYYEGANEIRAIYEMSIEAEEVLSYGNIEKYYELFPESLNIQKRATEKKINRKVYDILVESPKSLEMMAKKMTSYELKLIPKEVHEYSGFDFLVFNNYLALFQLEKSHPTAVLLESKAVADGFKMLHKTMWKMLK